MMFLKFFNHNTWKNKLQSKIEKYYSISANYTEYFFQSLRDNIYKFGAFFVRG